jgi:hypothetical protein
MTEITQFVALAFDFIDGNFAAAEPIVCANPALAYRLRKGSGNSLEYLGGNDGE